MGAIAAAALASAADEGRNIILSMLVVGLIFLAVIALGELNDWRARKRMHRRATQRNELPRGTVTFLFTDVEGSTRLLHELGAEAYAGALAEHRRVIRHACACHGGVEVDTQGDAFFFAFPSAPGALTAAQAATEALAGGPIQVRIGLHTGTPLVTEEGYVGDDVHFAARVAATSHGGQVVVSRSTRDQLDEDFALSDLGEHRLKDIEGPVPIFQLGAGSFPPLKTISNTNLPRPASSFVGREHELAEVLARIERGARLLALTGPGGSGKTRLAIEAAASVVPEYKAGVFWVGLAALRDPTLVTETIAQTLGAKNGLAEHIGEREMLLLLDNLEQVIKAAPELSALLTTCPNLTLLVTSRELLRVQGEVEYPVPPLAEPEAVTLFCERAQLEPTAEIAELCARLDNLPLAVELAAARTKALSPAQILERLSQRLDLLKGGRDAETRQQTLRATIAWSYDLLTDDEQELFRRLSVFVGGCALDAAEDVAGADLDKLQSLVEKSLLRFSNERYWMLETVRAYAFERLDRSGKLPVLRERKATYFLHLAERAEPELGGAKSAHWLDRLETERDNIRAAIDWSRTVGAVEVELRLVTALREFWRARGPVVEAFRRLDEAAHRAGSLLPQRRIEALRAAALSALEIGEPEAAQRLAQEVLKLARALGDTAGEISALIKLAHATAALGEVERAHSLMDDAVATARELGDRNALGHALLNSGVLAANRGDFDHAVELSERSLSEAGDAFDARGRAIALNNLASACIRLGDVGRAVETACEGLEVARAHGETSIVAGLLETLADAEVARDPIRAARLLGAAGTLMEGLGAALGEDIVVAVRAATDEAAHERAFGEGWQLPLDAAVEYALASVD
jgi:predicted ATPase/class 3 adenylate cyclase